MPETVKILATQYTKYKEETLNKMRGKTAQYWMTYCQIVDLIHLMQRVIKSNDIPLYSYALFQTIPIFFTTNQHNYARWMSLYALDLFNIKQENPVISQMLQNGGFNVNRTGNAFEELGVDMVLKQSIDVSAKNRLRGATEETEKYSLSILNNGKMKRNSFINECAEDETRFSKPIKKTKIVNFAISNFQKKNKITKCIKSCKHSRYKIYFW